MLAIKFRPMVAIAVTASAAVLGMAPTVASAAPASPGFYHADAAAGSRSAAVSDVEITNALATNMCLDAQNDPPHNPGTNGDGVQLWSCSDALNQRWTAPAPGVWGPIINMDGGKCLDAAIDGTNNPTHNGDKLQLWSCNGSSQQQWRFVVKNGGFYAIGNKYADDRGVAMSLDAATDGDSSPAKNGDRVMLWSWTGATQQTWG